MSDPHRLQRFVEAQDSGGTYDEAIAELRSGRKLTHWMWFVFPQVAGLGRSPTAQHYAISGLDEARAYLEHPLLGRRMIECAQVLADLPTSDPVAVFGPVDAQKLHSSITLFGLAAPDEPLFGRVLSKYFESRLDDGTIRLIGAAP